MSVQNPGVLLLSGWGRVTDELGRANTIDGSRTIVELHVTSPGGAVGGNRIIPF